MKAKILVVDDEKKLVDLIRDYLAKQGYDVITAYDGQTAVQRLNQDSPDLVVLDIMLPDLDGYDVCRWVRERAETPIIMLSAKSEQMDKIIGLELGADHYMTKPFSLRELTARIKAILRRFEQPVPEMASIKRGNLVITPPKHLVEVDGKPVELTATEFRILEAMATRPGQTFTRMQLIELAQGEAFEALGRSVDAHIKNIRKKLRETDDESEFIETVHGIGYRFRKQ